MVMVLIVVLEQLTFSNYLRSDVMKYDYYSLRFVKQIVTHSFNFNLLILIVSSPRRLIPFVLFVGGVDGVLLL